MPAAPEIDALVRDYFAVDAGTDLGRKQRAGILARLDLLPALSAADVKIWRKKIQLEQRKGQKLVGHGRGFLYESKDSGNSSQGKGKGEEAGKATGRATDKATDKDTSGRRGIYVVAGDTKQPKGIFIGLHGAHSNAEGGESLFADAVRQQGWVGVFPSLPDESKGWAQADAFVMDLLDHALRTWHVDPDKVYLGGYSLGGAGAWMLGVRHAERFAGIVPIAGAPPLGGAGIGALANLRDVALAFYHSSDDPVVPSGGDEQAAKLLDQGQQRFGGFVHAFTAVSGRGHDFPGDLLKGLLGKVAGSARHAVPDRVVWHIMQGGDRRQYWLWWPSARQGATVMAEIERKDNRLRVQCEGDGALGAAGLCVLLDERMVDTRKAVVVSCNDVEVWRGVPQAKLAVLLETSEPDIELAFTARVSVAKAR